MFLRSVNQRNHHFQDEGDLIKGNTQAYTKWGVQVCPVPNHPGLAEINAPIGPQEVMPLLKVSPLKTATPPCTKCSGYANEISFTYAK